MTYQALYRTYRPKKFNDVVGQDVIVKTLKNAIKSNKIAHAYIFSGPHGTGKTSIAKIFANAVNCEADKSLAPCGKCPTCKAIQEESISDVVEIDAASNNGVDEIRELRDKVKYMPAMGKYKVYIIDEVHMLTIQAFNALLKTLEEPPSHVIFILATTEVNKLPLTILSRCQRFDFRGITVKEIIKRLNKIIKDENITISKEAIKEIANQADGSMRDAISLLDQVYSFTEGEITEQAVDDVSGSVSKDSLLKLVNNLLDKNIAKAFNILNDVIEDGKEIAKIVADLIIVLRDILIEKNIASDTKQSNQIFKEIVEKFSNDRLYFYLEILNETQNELRWTNQKRAYLELAIIKMIDHQSLDNIEANEKIELLMNRINQLELDLKNIDVQEVKVVEKENQKDIKKPLKNKRDSKKKDTLKKPITVKDIEEVLNNGDRAKKEELQRIWPALKKLKDPKKEVIAQSLSQAEVVASTKEKAILVYPDKTTCLMMLNDVYKKSALNLLNGKKHYIDDYLCIDRDSWNILLADFKEQWKNKANKKPKLKEIDLGLFESKSKKWQPKTLKVANDFFGENIVKVKE